MNILIIDDEPTICADYTLALELAGHKCNSVASGSEALNLMTTKSYDIAIVDLRLIGDMDGLTTGKQIKLTYPSVRLIMVTGNYDKELKDAAQICKFEACIKKGNDLDGLVRLVNEMSLPCGSGNYELEMIGESQVFKTLLYEAKIAAGTTNSILIIGETGTGKEKLANFIHDMSRRSSKPFVAVNCGAIPSTMIESTLFGHKRGSFTGSTDSREGKFQAANHGTIFLDEIGTLKYDLQTVLLRVLQEGQIERVGVDIPIPVDVRVISATNSQLDELVSKGEFREDLFYRLNVFPLRLPPLRDRGYDILLLAEHFLKVERETSANKINKILLPEAKDALMSYHWPGNIRQLENIITQVYHRTGSWQNIYAENICEALIISGAYTVNNKSIKSPTREQEAPLVPESPDQGQQTNYPHTLRDIATYLDGIKLHKELSGSSRGEIMLVENAYLHLLERIVTEAKQLQRGNATGGLSYLTGRNLLSHITTRIEESFAIGEVPCFKYLGNQPEKTAKLTTYKEKKKKMAKINKAIMD